MSNFSGVKKLVLFFCFLTLFSKAQWINTNANLGVDLSCVAFANDSTAVIGGKGRLFVTTNKGISWRVVGPSGTLNDTLNHYSCNFRRIVFTNMSFVAVGQDTLQHVAVAFQIDPQGTSCTSTYNGAAGSALYDVCQCGAYTIGVGKGGLKISSGNYGQTWTGFQNNLSTTSDLYSATSYNSGNGDLAILSGGKIYYCSGYPSYGWSTYNSAPVMGLIRASSSGGLTGVGGSLYTSYNAGQTWSQNNNYNYAPLNGRDVFYRSNLNGSIATDHGIYRTSPASFSVWEFQNSSTGFNLNGIAFAFYNTNIGIAVGKNGLVLRTSNAGGPSAPFVKYTSANGGCINSTVSFTNISPNVYTFNWKNNAVQFSTAYNSSYTYNSIGNYSVSLIGNNGVTADSFTSVIHIVNPPDFTKTYTVSDPLLCKSGSSNITIHNSEIGVDYLLCKLPSLTPIDTVSGNGADAILNTGIISDSTMYRIKAMISGVNCGGFLGGFPLVGVEKTKANFHVQLINAELGENVNCINHSRQAAIYNWTFGGGSNINSSSLINPPYITYTQIGQKLITLEAISIHGCHDTLTKNGPFVFDNTDTALTKPCWAFNIDGQNPGFLYETEKIYDIKTDVNNDLLICGAYTKAIFPSRAGVGYGRTKGFGHYLVKYNSNGVLKWIVLSKDSISSTINPNEGGSEGRHLEVGEDKSIIMTGVSVYLSNMRLFTNTGDSVNMTPNGFINKFDSTGKLMWYTSFNANISGITGLLYNYGFTSDKQGNSYLAPNTGLSNVYSSTYGNQTVNSTFVGLCKFNRNGGLEWVAKAPGASNISTDKWSNVYLSGKAGVSTAQFYSSNGDSVVASCGRSYITKYDSSGIVKWVLAFCAKDVNIFGVSCDNANGVYITGMCTAYYGDSILFPSRHQGLALRDVGPYFVAAYDSSGDFRWAQGTDHYIASATGDVISTGRLSKNVYAASNFPYTSGSTSLNFTSANGLVAPMQQNIYNASYYIASYDTSGVLNFVNCETGSVCTNQTGAVPQVFGITDDYSSNVYVAGSLRGSPGYSYQVLSTQLYPNKQDGFLVKIGGCFSPNSFYSQVNNLDKKVTLQVMPNPNNGRFSIKTGYTNFPIKAVVYDIRGCELSETTIHSDMSTFDISTYDNGMYFIQFTDKTGNIISSNKVVVSK